MPTTASNDSTHYDSSRVSVPWRSRSSRPGRTYGPNIKELWRMSRFGAQWPHIFGIAWNMIRLNTKQNSDWFVWVALSRGSRGLETPDGHYASRREVNQNPVTKPGLKQGLVVMFWAPKIASEAISQHQIPKHFPGGACPQTPLASTDTLHLYR